MSKMAPTVKLGGTVQIVQETEAEAVEAFRVLATHPAVVTIDLHRGHLDPSVATLPLPAEVAAALMSRTVRFLDEVRDRGVPIIHVVTAYRDRREIIANPYWRFQSGRAGSIRSGIADHNLGTTRGVEMMPGIRKEPDLLVHAKKRYDCFLGTDLGFTLRTHEINAVLLLGVNTNSCVIATAISASVRDYAVFVVEEGVQTMAGQSLHDAARQVIAGSFGWLIHAADVLQGLHKP